MPIYLIETKGEEKKRLVKADSAAGAIRHCAENLFTATTISSVEQAAEHFAAGVKLETAGEKAADPPKGGETPTLSFNIETGMARAAGQDDRPATIDELASVDPGATWRVNAETGLIQRLAADADSETGWEEIREATPEEIEALKPKGKGAK